MIGFIKALFGGAGAVKDVAEVFTVNKEAQAARLVGLDAATVAQYAAEFHERQNRTWIDALADGLNRLVRPVLTIAIFAPIPMTIYAPDKAGNTWAALATIPTEYWAVMGVVISFYFGGRMQVKALGSRKSLEAAASAARALVKEDAAEPIEAEPVDEKAAKPADKTEIRDFVAELRAMQ